VDFKITPYNHQLAEISYARRMSNRGLFWEMGTGKTAGCIHLMRMQYAKEKRLMRTLILGPKIVKENWKREIIAHSKISPRDVIILDGSQKRRVTDFIKAVSDSNGSLVNGKIIVLNYEAVLMDDLYKAIMLWGPEILVCDESHRLRTHNAKRSKKVAIIADTAKHKYLLTGTPVLKDARDLFMQMRILDGGETLGKNYYVFQKVYFEDANAAWAARPGYFPKWEPRPEMYPILNEKIYKKCSRILKEECLDLPPLVRSVINVELSPEQARMYKEMKNEFITFVKNQKDQPKAVVAQLAITKALRLQQIVAGFAKADDGSVTELKTPRLEALEELITDLVPQGKLIIWACFKQNYKQIRDLCAKLGVSSCEVHGDVSDADRKEAIHGFTKGNTQVFIGNQAAGGIGINLVEAPNAIFYSRNFSLEQDAQAEARNHRGGSEIHKKITRIDLIAKNTIDELIADALQSKQNIADRILDWTYEL
jgi:SNF2 family DNA or RNA helicase